MKALPILLAVFGALCGCPAPESDGCGEIGQACCAGVAPCITPYADCDDGTCSFIPYWACPADYEGEACRTENTCQLAHTIAPGATNEGTFCTRSCVQATPDCNLPSNGLPAQCLVVDGVGQCYASCNPNVACPPDFTCEGGTCLRRY